MTTLASMAVDALADSDQRTLALRALEHLDTEAAASAMARLRGLSGSSEVQGRLAQLAPRQSDQTKWWLFGALIALAILWSAYSVYRFNHPTPSRPAVVVDSSSAVASSSPAESAREWYHGGTLHKATAREWQAATYRNRLATSADFVAGVKAASNMKELLVRAAGLERCTTEGTADAMLQDLKVADAAAACLVLLDYD